MFTHTFRIKYSSLVQLLFYFENHVRRTCMRCMTSVKSYPAFLEIVTRRTFYLKVLHQTINCTENIHVYTYACPILSTFDSFCYSLIIVIFVAFVLENRMSVHYSPPTYVNVDKVLRVQ